MQCELLNVCALAWGASGEELSLLDHGARLASFKIVERERQRIGRSRGIVVIPSDVVVVVVVSRLVCPCGFQKISHGNK